MSEDEPMTDSAPQFQNAGSESEVEVRTIQSNRLRDMEAKDLAFVLGNAESRRFFMRLLGLTGIHRLSSPDPIHGQRDEGARSVGLEMLRILGEAGVDVFPRLMVEHAMQAETDRNEVASVLLKRARGESELV